jgi:hypothetical protein
MEKRYGVLLKMSFSLFFSKNHEWGKDMGYSSRCPALTFCGRRKKAKVKVFIDE